MYALLIIFRSSQSLNSYNEFDDTFNAKTPSKCPDGTKAKKKAFISSNVEGKKSHKKGVVVNAVNGPNTRNEKSVEELEANGVECTHYSVCNKLDYKLDDIENDKLALENTISCLEVKLSDSMAQQSAKEKELKECQLHGQPTNGSATIEIVQDLNEYANLEQIGGIFNCEGDSRDSIVHICLSQYFKSIMNEVRDRRYNSRK